MTIRASRSEMLREPFVVRLEDIRKLSTQLEQQGGTVTFEVMLRDNVTRRYTSFEDVSKVENTVLNPVVKLGIDARTKDSSLEFSCNWKALEYPHLWLTVSGHEDKVTAASEALNNRMLAMRPWYAFLAKVEIWGFVIGMAIAGILLLSLYVLAKHDTRPTVSTDDAKAKASAVVLLFFIGGGVVIGLLEILRRRLFPIGAFALGQGLDRYELLEKVRWGVVVAFLVSIAASAIFVVL